MAPRWSVDLNLVAAKMKLDIGTAKRGICLKLFSHTVLATPVLTGALRGNWQCTIGQPIREPLPEGTEDKGGQATIDKIARVVDGLGIVNETINLCNNLPYAYRIEYEGWSHTKAPNGMVRISLNNIVGNLQDFIKDAV